MHKPRHHWHLDQALFVLLVMIGAVVSTVLDVQAIAALGDGAVSCSIVSSVMASSCAADVVQRTHTISA